MPSVVNDVHRHGHESEHVRLSTHDVAPVARAASREHELACVVDDHTVDVEVAVAQLRAEPVPNATTSARANIHDEDEDEDHDAFFFFAARSVVAG